MVIPKLLDGPYDHRCRAGDIDKGVSCTRSGVFLANKFREFCILLTINAFQIELSRLISLKTVDAS